MAIVFHGVRSRTQRRQGRVRPRPSIREVCLVGIENPGSIPVQGGRLSWSGRVYQVEVPQSGPAGGDEPIRYVHLSALAEG
jgi:hypothetical protein